MGEQLIFAELPRIAVVTESLAPEDQRSQFSARCSDESNLTRDAGAAPRMPLTPGG